MVEIKPFPAIIYNFAKIHKPEKVICPPYDIISPLEAKLYRHLSSYNMIRLTLPKKNSRQSQYRNSASCFHKWLKTRILLQDKEPAIYFYQQEFKIDKMNNFSSTKDGRFKRLGFIASLSLYSSSSIFGHEHTYIEPKEDRFKLLVEVQANLEPIFVLFSDPRGFFQNLFNKYILTSKPAIRFRDRENNMNTLWRLTESSILKRIITRMENKILFIADGHHRYEVSLNYRDLIRRRLKSNFPVTGDYNYIMVYLCPVESSGLVIRPVHRLVRGIDQFCLDKFTPLFHIQKTNQKSLFNLLRTQTAKRRKLGVYVNKNYYIFTLKNYKILDRIDKDYRSVDVYLLNHLILKRILKVNPDDKDRVIFSAKAGELIRQADSDKTSLVFLLRPAGVADIIYLAKAGKKMPAKTTYFYPKVPSGLVIYKFRDYS